MKVVVIGDVSWKSQYHLGDEAMTEVALEQLQKRGAEVTLVAGDPETSRGLYGVECVSVFGFANSKTRARREARIDEVLAGARGERELSASDRETVATVRAADAVVVAGGGNLNSSGVHHLYERLTLKRLAEMFGIPFYVSSQTVGPHILPYDLNLVREIAEYARAFGTREPTTTAMMRELCGDSAAIVHTWDDALLLTPAAPASVGAEPQARYVIGSFTFHPGNTGLSPESYYRALAATLDMVVEECDVDVYLLPHMGVLGVDSQQGEDNDVFAHDRIVTHSTSGRISSRPMISARELLALTADAEFTISTRYHPLVFGAAVGVPAVGLVLSAYSAQRMRGALSGTGAESFAVPFESWRDPFGRKVLAALRDRRAEIAAKFALEGAAQQRYQSAWWDGIVADIASTGSVCTRDVSVPEALSWANPCEEDLLAVSRAAQETINTYRMNNHVTVRAHAARLTALENQLKAQLTENAQLRGEISRISDSKPMTWVRRMFGGPRSAKQSAE